MFNFIFSRPTGWLRNYLSSQMNGLTGHIGESGYPFSIVEWGQLDFRNTDENPNWWVYEQTGYWLDGYIRCAIALGDQKAINNAARIIYNVIDHPDDDGYLGPQVLKRPVPKLLEKDGKLSCVRWPHLIFFRAVIALYDYNHDTKLTDAMVKHYLGSPFDYQRGRNSNNIEILCWLYKATGNTEILNLANSIFEGYKPHSEKEDYVSNFLSEELPVGHGVSYSEFSKVGALLYELSGEKYLLRLSVRAIDKLVRFDMLPDGCPSSQEEIDGDDPMACHETCVISDFSWALENIFAITKDVKYGDLIERCMFNAAPGAVLENFRGLQYFSCANQILSDNQSSHVPTSRAAKLMSYRPNPGTECCPGNVNRAMPNYALSMWAKENNNYYAYLLGPSEVRDGETVIKEETIYPFGDSFRFLIQTKSKFDLFVRCPSWYKNPKLCVMGTEKEVTVENGFIRITVEGSTDIELKFEAEIERVKAPRGIFFRRGPLVYTLGQKGERKIDHEEERSSAEFPAMNMTPLEKWNYGIPVNAETVFHSEPESHGFDLDYPLPYIETNAIEIKNLKLRNKTVKREDLVEIQLPNYAPGDYVLTPEIMNPEDAELGRKYKIILKPYGACKLRMTVFTEVNC